MKPSNSLRLWGYACLVCGLLLFTNGVLAETQPHEPIIANNAINAMALAGSLSGTLGAFGFLFAFLGLQSIEAAGSGWLPKLSGGLILIGIILGTIGASTRSLTPIAYST